MLGFLTGLYPVGFEGRIHYIPLFLHIRHVRELFFESTHQPLKQAALSGNGHDDSRRAFSRILETESFSRVASDFGKFNVPCSISP